MIIFNFPKKKYIYLIFFILMCDILSKEFIKNNLGINNTICINSFISLTHIDNCGISFNLLKDILDIWIIIFINTIIIFILIFLLFFNNKKILNIAYSFMLSGSLGNLYSRIIMSKVIDFIDLHIYNLHIINFNIADFSIFIGMILLLLF